MTRAEYVFTKYAQKVPYKNVANSKQNILSYPIYPEMNGEITSKYITDFTNPNTYNSTLDMLRTYKLDKGKKFDSAILNAAKSEDKKLGEPLSPGVSKKLIEELKKSKLPYQTDSKGNLIANNYIDKEESYS